MAIYIKFPSIRSPQYDIKSSTNVALQNSVLHHEYTPQSTFWCHMLIPHQVHYTLTFICSPIYPIGQTLPSSNFGSAPYSFGVTSSQNPPPSGSPRSILFCSEQVTIFCMEGFDLAWLMNQTLLYRKQDVMKPLPVLNRKRRAYCTVIWQTTGHPGCGEENIMVYYPKIRGRLCYTYWIYRSTFGGEHIVLVVGNAYQIVDCRVYSLH